MEGYLTQWNGLYLCFYCSSDPRCCFFAFIIDWSDPPLIFQKNYTKGEFDEFWPSINSYGNTI